MSYNFNFDLSKFPKAFFREIAKVSNERKIHKKLGSISRDIAKKFKFYEYTGLPVSDGLMVVEDLIDIYIKNIINKKKFSNAKKKPLLLPHCSRKYMDNRCKAKINPKFSSYECSHCSPDCLINKATKLGRDKGYDVYVLPGGSCIRKILSQRKYKGVIGVACSEEIKMGNEFLDAMKIPSQSVPLIKNGCSNTKFDIKTLKSVL